MWPILNRPLTGVGVLVAQVLRAAHRDDLPSLQDQDPTGEFGDAGLPRLRICVLGDSTVTAPGVVPPSAAWPQRLGRYLGDRYRVELHSVAVGGSKARDVLNDQLAPALSYQPDIAIVSVGANDALRGTSIARFEAEYRQLLEKLLAFVPLVVASGVGDLGTVHRLPTLARAIGRVRGRAVNNAIRRVAHGRRRVRKTETWGGDWRWFEWDPEGYFAGDQFHASAQGHSLFAGSMYAAVEALMATDEFRDLISSRGSPESGT